MSHGENLLKWKTVNNFCRQTKGPIVCTQRQEPGRRRKKRFGSPNIQADAPAAPTLTGLI